MLPRETSVRQLKKLRAETKGTDIGDLTKDDRLNHNVPNLQYIGNPIDTGIDSYEDFTEKDSQLQTIAFKSKLVNKPLVKETKKETKYMEKNIQKFEDFEFNNVTVPNDIRMTKDVKYFDDIEDGDDDDIYDDDTVECPDCDGEGEIDGEECERCEGDGRVYRPEDIPPDVDYYNDDEDEDDDLSDDLDENVLTFESFTVKASVKEEKQPDYTILGQEKESKSNPNFGIAAVKSEEIKTIGSFSSYTKLIDPVTPKERTIGGNAGVFIDNDTVKGYVNRIDGKDVYVESLEDPMVIKKFNIKDVVKTKKEKKD